MDVTLNVPVELDNEYQNKIGYLDWEFRIEEYPVDDDDPKPPQTGDNSNVELWLTVAGVSLAVLVILLVWRKKNRERAEDAVRS